MSWVIKIKERHHHIQEIFQKLKKNKKEHSQTTIQNPKNIRLIQNQLNPIAFGVFFIGFSTDFCKSDL